MAKRGRWNRDNVISTARAMTRNRKQASSSADVAPTPLDCSLHGQQQMRLLPDGIPVHGRNLLAKYATWPVQSGYRERGEEVSWRCG